jgi:DNA-binding MarR family transcriptional regulator
MDQAVAPAIPAGAVDLGPLHDSLGFLLRMAQLRIYDHYFTELRDFELRPGEFSALIVIMCNPGIRQGVLAQQLKIKRAHMTKLIRSLEARGYVERTIPDEDRRSVTLTLTPRGQTSMQWHRQRFVEYERLPKSALSREEERKLIGLLQSFVGIDGGAAS